jgi:diadenylate cyclase
MHTLHWQSAVDFVVLALAVYLLLLWGRQAHALRLAVSIFGLRVGALVARELGLLMTAWVLDAATLLALFALLVVFQPEIRRGLMRLDVLRRSRQARALPVAADISRSAWALARSGCGALFAIVRQDPIEDLVTAGVAVGGRVSPELLEAVFQKTSILHDGAAVIDGDQLVRLGAILPLTQKTSVPLNYGTRHRAAMGLAERSDALVVVVSEERGKVTLFSGTQARAVEDETALSEALNALTGLRASRPRQERRWRTARVKLALIAIAISALVWSVTFLVPGTAVRVRAIPVEFTQVPAGLAIAAQSTEAVNVWLRGTDFLLDSATLGSMVARCSLAGAHAGVNSVDVRPDAIEIPFGLRVDGLSPSRITVRLDPE